MLTRIQDALIGKAPISAKRSKDWSKVRAEFLQLNPRCAVCEGNKKLNVHHIVPFHVDPTLELEPSNLITLCERKKYGIHCHLLVGHLGNYRNINTHLFEDVELLNRRLKEWNVKPQGEAASSKDDGGQDQCS